LAHLDHSVLDAPTMPIKRLGLLERCLRISKGGGQIALSGGFIAFDHKEWIRLLGTQKLPELPMRMQRIKGTDASENRAAWEAACELRGSRWFFRPRRAEPRRALRLSGEAGKQVRGNAFRCPGSSHGFAIDSEGISGRGRTGGPDPG